MRLKDRLVHAWNAFQSSESGVENYAYNYGPGSSSRPDRTRLNYGAEKSISASLYARLAIDVASVSIRHVRLDQNGRFLDTINSGLDRCLSLSANIDQTGRAFIQDVAFSLFDEGVVAIVPIDTSENLRNKDSFDILSMRVGKVVEWFPRDVRVELYNDRTGLKDQIILPKNKIAIVENPLYPVMNEPNGTLRRLIEKLNLLDAIDIESGAGRLDLLITLPYTIRTEARQLQAQKRREDIETQLKGSRYGVAYIDAAEKVTQLNRPAENQLMEQIEFLTSSFYSSLGISQEVFNGTAPVESILNYYNRTVEPVVGAIVDAMKVPFITKTGRSQGQSISAFRDPFKLVPTSELGDLADSFTRNAVLSSNEIRSIIGFRPSQDPSAEELRNKNLNPPTGAQPQEGLQQIPQGEEANGQY